MRHWPFPCICERGPTKRGESAASRRRRSVRVYSHNWPVIGLLSRVCSGVADEEGTENLAGIRRLFTSSDATLRDEIAVAAWDRVAIIRTTFCEMRIIRIRTHSTSAQSLSAPGVMQAELPPCSARNPLTAVSKARMTSAGTERRSASTRFRQPAGAGGV